MTDTSVEPAVARARAVVGLYGDPTVSWSIALDATFSNPVDTGPIALRCRALALERPMLGPAVHPQACADAEYDDLLAAILDRPYGDQDPLLRVGYATSGRRLVVGGHHGAIDGLGLIAAMGRLLEARLETRARGIGGRTARQSFARSSLNRLTEVVFRPPTRLAAPAKAVRNAPRQRPGPAGDVTARLDVEHLRADTARSVSAAASALAEWNDRLGAAHGRVVVGIGASRRDGTAAAPDRDTAFLRVRLPASLELSAVRQALESGLPEPTFPDRPVGRWARVVTGALRGRLGSSLLVSNLGLVAVPPGLERLAIYPAAAGPRALAVGVVSTPSFTTVTVRMPRADFARADATEICRMVVDRLARLEPTGRQNGS